LDFQKTTMKALQRKMQEFVEWGEIRIAVMLSLFYSNMKYFKYETKTYELLTLKPL